MKAPRRDQESEVVKKGMQVGDLDGQQGCRVERYTRDGCVWHRHLDTDGKVVGLELISVKAHWWLDRKIQRPRLRQEDWDFSELNDTRNDWQLPGAWQYECWREWQPWSDVALWQSEDQAWQRSCDRKLRRFKKMKALALKKLKKRRTTTKRGSQSLHDTMLDAGASGLDPFYKSVIEGNPDRLGDYNPYLNRMLFMPRWILRNYSDFFPKTPWTKIPMDRRNELKTKKDFTKTHLDASVRAERARQGKPLPGRASDRGKRGVLDRLLRY